MVPDEEDGPNLQGPSGHFSERTWKTVSAQEMETSWYSMVEDTLLPPKALWQEGAHSARHTWCTILWPCTEALGFLMPCSSPVPGAAGAVRWMPAAARSCAITEQCWGCPLLENCCLCRVHPVVVRVCSGASWGTAVF